MRTIPSTTTKWSATVAFCLLLVACASLSVTRFDPVTYKSLTDLVPVASRIYTNFSEDPLDQGRVDAFALQLEQLEVYETWKGPENQDMVKQIKELRAMFERHVADRTTNGAWSKVYAANKKELFFKALTEAIKTETAKNRSVR